MTVEALRATPAGRKAHKDRLGQLERERVRQVAEKGTDTLFMPQGDVHVTDERAQWIARVFADAILEQRLLPAPGEEGR